MRRGRRKYRDFDPHLIGARPTEFIPVEDEGPSLRDIRASDRRAAREEVKEAIGGMFALGAYAVRGTPSAGKKILKDIGHHFLYPVYIKKNPTPAIKKVRIGTLVAGFMLLVNSMFSSAPDNRVAAPVSQGNIAGAALPPDEAPVSPEAFAESEAGDTVASAEQGLFGSATMAFGLAAPLPVAQEGELGSFRSFNENAYGGREIEAKPANDQPYIPQVNNDAPGVQGMSNSVEQNPQDYMAIMNGIEGTGVNPLSGAAGKWQFLEKTWRQTVKRCAPEVARGKTDAQIEALRFQNGAFKDRMGWCFTNANIQYFKDKTGQSPSPWQTYLMHQQGAGGAIALLRNPYANAIDVMSTLYKGGRSLKRCDGRKLKDLSAQERSNLTLPEKVIMHNGGTCDMMAVDFMNFFYGHYMRRQIAINKSRSVAPGRR